jgi:hypothetical protein
VYSGARPLPTVKPAASPLVVDSFLGIGLITELALGCQYEICYDDQQWPRQPDVVPYSFPVAAFCFPVTWNFSLFRGQGKPPGNMLRSQWLAQHRNARKRCFSL